jgi:hypothetical protein
MKNSALYIVFLIVQCTGASETLPNFLPRVVRCPFNPDNAASLLQSLNDELDVWEIGMDTADVFIQNADELHILLGTLQLDDEDTCAQLIDVAQLLGIDGQMHKRDAVTPDGFFDDYQVCVCVEF